MNQQDDLKLKIDSDIAHLVSDLLSKLILEINEKNKRAILYELLKMPGYTQSLTLNLKEDIEKTYQRLVGEIQQIAEGSKIHPTTHQRIIPGFQKDEE